MSGILSLVCAQEPSGDSREPVKLEEIPPRLFQVQDKNGFFWQAAGNGAVTSGETQYLQSGLNLIVAGENFAPGEAYVQEPGVDGVLVGVRFEETRKDYQISRDLWFDSDRSAVRVLDTVRNTGAVSQTISLQWRTTFPFPWQSLHGPSGELLNTQPTLELSKDDYGMVVHFSQAEGRHDTLFLLGSEKDDLPTLNASSNSRELSFSRDLILKPGESRSVMYWMLQRNLTDIEEAGNAFVPIYQRSRLILPGVDPEDYEKVVNFPVEAFPTSGVSPNLRNLFSLNAIVNAVGLHRRSEDILWISNANQLACEVDRSTTLHLTSPSIGDVAVPLDSVAAIQGSAGSGRRPLLFLRNGQVLTGEFTENGVPAKTGGSDTSTTLEFSEINLLLLSSSSKDGEPPSGVTHFIETLNDEVIAVSASENSAWTVVSPWGEQVFPFTEIEEVTYFSDPFPRHRVLTKDGSLLDVFSKPGAAELVSSDGAKLSLEMSTVSRVWGAGAQKRSLSDTGEQWIDFTEVPEDLGSSASILLSGNSLLSGTLEASSLELAVDDTRIAIDADQISSLTKLHSLSSNGDLEFEVELVNQDRLTGTLISPVISVRNAFGTLNVPVVALQSYRISNEAP